MTRDSRAGNPPVTTQGFHCAMVLAFAAGGWWVGFAVASVAIVAVAALVVSVISTVNLIERQVASIVRGLDAAADATRPLLDLVETNQALAMLMPG